MTLDNVFMTAVDWILELIKDFSNVWATLSEPVIEFGSHSFSYLSLIGLTSITTILIIKMIDALPIV